MNSIVKTSKEALLWGKTIIWDGGSMIESLFVAEYLPQFLPAFLLQYYEVYMQNIIWFYIGAAALSTSGKMLTAANSVLTQKALHKVHNVVDLSSREIEILQSIQKRQRTRLIIDGRMDKRKMLSNVFEHASNIIFPPLAPVSALLDARNVIGDFIDIASIAIIKANHRSSQ